MYGHKSESKDSSTILWGWRVVFYITASVSALSLTLWALYMKDSVIPELNSPTQSATSHRASKLSSDEEFLGSVIKYFIYYFLLISWYMYVYVCMYVCVGAC